MVMRPWQPIRSSPLAVANNPCSRCVSARLLPAPYATLLHAAPVLLEHGGDLCPDTCADGIIQHKTSTFGEHAQRWGSSVSWGCLRVWRGVLGLILWSALSLLTPWPGTKRAS